MDDFRLWQTQIYLHSHIWFNIQFVKDLIEMTLRLVFFLAFALKILITICQFTSPCHGQVWCWDSLSSPCEEPSTDDQASPLRFGASGCPPLPWTGRWEFISSQKFQMLHNDCWVNAHPFQITKVSFQPRCLLILLVQLGHLEMGASLKFSLFQFHLLQHVGGQEECND